MGYICLQSTLESYGQIWMNFPEILTRAKETDYSILVVIHIWIHKLF